MMMKMTKMMKRVMLGTMTVTTLLATSAGASAATVTTTPVDPVQTTVTLKHRPANQLGMTKIHLKRTNTTQIANQVQTTVDASALNLDQQHRDQQLK